jgi:hypothetical protein
MPQVVSQKTLRRPQVYKYRYYIYLSHKEAQVKGCKKNYHIDNLTTIDQGDNGQNRSTALTR